MAITKSGANIVYYNAKVGDAVTSGNLAEKSWFMIESIASSSSALPSGLKVGSIFKTKAGTNANPALTLGTGDSVRPITLGEPIAKTEVGLQFEEGSIDVTDDSSNGYNSYILDGYVEFSSSLNGFLKYNPDTEELEAVSDEVMSRFIETVTDDGQGNYTFIPKENKRLLAFICLNRKAKAGQKQNWLIMWQYLASLDLGGGLKDPQKRDIAVKKADGPITRYVRTAIAGDEL